MRSMILIAVVLFPSITHGIVREVQGDPYLAICPDYPSTSALAVEVRPRKQVVMFGIVPQFEVRLRNESDRSIRLFTREEEGLALLGYYTLYILDRNGHNRGFGVPELAPLLGEPDLEPQDELVLILPPESFVESRNKYYRKDARVLLPGTYRILIHFVVWNDGQPECLIADEALLTVADDGSPEIEIAQAVQSSRGVEEHVEFIISADADNNVRLYLKNTGTFTVHFENSVFFCSTDPQGLQHCSSDGPCGRSVKKVEPGEIKSSCVWGFGSWKEIQPYTVWVQYYDPAGKFMKESNKLTLWGLGEPQQEPD